MLYNPLKSSCPLTRSGFGLRTPAASHTHISRNLLQYQQSQLLITRVATCCKRKLCVLKQGFYVFIRAVQYLASHNQGVVVVSHVSAISRTCLCSDQHRLQLSEASQSKQMACLVFYYAFDHVLQTRYHALHGKSSPRLRSVHPVYTVLCCEK